MQIYKSLLALEAHPRTILPHASRANQLTVLARKGRVGFDGDENLFAPHSRKSNVVSRQLRPEGFLESIRNAVPVALVWQQLETGECNALAFFLNPARDFGQRLGLLGQHRAFVGGEQLVVSTANLSAEQSRAINQLLASRDQVLGLRGAAGVGKTTALNALRQSLAADGITVLAVAPTTSATDVLRREGFREASTVAVFLLRNEPAPAGAVLFVDEAGLLSNKQGVGLLRWAEANSARVILVGDTKQHSAVEAGDFLHVLEQHSRLERAEIGLVQRQQTRAYRTAIQLMANGWVKSGLEKLDALGWVQEGRADYLGRAAAEYAERSREQAANVICVCPTWEENHALTALIREQLKREGKLTGGRNFTVHDSLAWTHAQRANHRNFQPGLLLAFHENHGEFAKGTSWTVTAASGPRLEVSRGGKTQTLGVKAAAKAFDVGQPRETEFAPGDWLLLRGNNKSAGLLNGRVHQVEAIEGEVMRLEGGLSLNSQEFKQFSHGYAITSHKSQGLTVDHVIIAAERLDGKAAYVACSRGKWSCSVHAPDKALLLANLPLEGRPAALDFLTGGDGLNRPAAYEVVNTARRLAAGMHWSTVLAAWQLQLCQQAAHWIKELVRQPLINQEQDIT